MSTGQLNLLKCYIPFRAGVAVDELACTFSCRRITAGVCGHATREFRATIVQRQLRDLHAVSQSPVSQAGVVVVWIDVEADPRELRRNTYVRTQTTNQITSMDAVSMSRQRIIGI
jgi:hypothetical protein